VCYGIVGMTVSSVDLSAERKGILAAFIRFLNDRLGYDFNVEKEFDKRFLLQKYVFLAKYLGLDLAYDYSLYMYGPYSKELADDYYELARQKVLPEASLPPEFNADAFVSLVKDRDAKWLETAASILMVLEKYPGMSENEVYDILRMSKPWLTYESFEKVYKILSMKQPV